MLHVYKSTHYQQYVETIIAKFLHIKFFFLVLPLTIIWCNFSLDFCGKEDNWFLEYTATEHSTLASNVGLPKNYL